MGSINKIVKRSPGFIKKLYYDRVPFGKRYGKVYEDTLSFLNDSSQWDQEKKEWYQLTEMKVLLHHCYSNVPYYRQVFLNNGWTPEDFQTVDDLKQFPVLTKKIIMRHRNDLIAGDMMDYRRYPITTSGSSGDKLEFFVTDDVFKKEAAFNMRAYQEQGALMYDTPSVWLRRYVPKNSESPLWYYDHELKRLYMSAYHLNDDTIGKCIGRINSGSYETIGT